MCQRPPQFSFNPSSQPLPYQPPAAPLQQPSPQPQPRAPINQNSFSPSNGGHIGSSFQCAEDFGFYPHVKSCDKYWACDNGKFFTIFIKIIIKLFYTGTATLKTCGNGLVFDDSDTRRENCAYPFSVDCGDRSDLGNAFFKGELLIFLFFNYRTTNKYTTLSSFIWYISRSF